MLTLQKLMDGITMQYYPCGYCATKFLFCNEYAEILFIKYKNSIAYVLVCLRKLWMQHDNLYLVVMNVPDLIENYSTMV